MIDNEFYIQLYENKIEYTDIHMSLNNQFNLSVYKYIKHGELEVFIEDLEKTWEILEKNSIEREFFFSYDYDIIIFLGLILNKNLFNCFKDKFDKDKEKSKYTNFLVFNYFFNCYESGLMTEDVLNLKIDKNRMNLFRSILDSKDYDASKSINSLLSISRRGMNEYASPIFLEGLIFIWLLKSKQIEVNLNEKSKRFLPEELCNLNIHLNYIVKNK